MSHPPLCLSRRMHCPHHLAIESIMFAAILKLQGIQPDALMQKVQKVMKELGIDHIADQCVGGTASLKGVSGGERRRVTIGMAIVSDPAGIILDEPLSGLDSYNAFAVTDCLKSLAKMGRVVMFSLHQPSKEMYSTSLDQVIFMAHGRIMYQGSPDVHGLMEKLSIPMKTSYAESMLQAMNDPEVCALMHREHALNAEATPVFENSSSKSLVTEQIDHSRSSSALLQIAMTFNRTFKDILRNKSLLILHVSISIAAGLIMGGLFYQLTFDTDGVQGRFGGIFVSLCFLALTSLTIIDLLMNERTVVISEVLSGLYPGVVYLISKITCDGLLLRALPALLYSIPFYFMAGFRYDAARFFSFAFVLMLFSMCIGVLAMLVTLLSKTPGQSSFIMNTLLLFELSFTGFLINVNAITPVLQWIHWLSQFYYAFEAIIQTELNQGEYDLILSAPGLKPINLTDTAGEVFINTLGYQVDTSTRNIGILIAYYYGFAILCIAVFYVRTRTGILRLV
jgi:ABC-type multidrug transport system ATPase subunit